MPRGSRWDSLVQGVFTNVHGPAVTIRSVDVSRLLCLLNLRWDLSVCVAVCVCVGGGHCHAREITFGDFVEQMQAMVHQYGTTDIMKLHSQIKDTVRERATMEVAQERIHATITNHVFEVGPRASRPARASCSCCAALICRRRMLTYLVRGSCLRLSSRARS